MAQTLGFQIRFLLTKSVPQKVKRTAFRYNVRLSNFVSRKLDPRSTVLPKKLLKSIQAGALNYSYRGLRMMKNPFDLALYLMLLDRLEPRTIVEIGSAYGGSALFFRDQTQIRGLGTKVWSLDVNPIRGHDDELLQFLHGDIYCLNQSALPKILSEARRPLLIIEDGPHTFEGSLAALNFFVPYMKSGDMIVIEDGNLRDLGRGYYGLRNGPHRAIKRFMSDHPGKLQISTSLCDFYGRNVTWNVDGYLERI